MTALLDCKDVIGTIDFQSSEKFPITPEEITT